MNFVEKSFRHRDCAVCGAFELHTEGFGVWIPAPRSEVVKRIALSLLYGPPPPCPLRNVFQYIFLMKLKKDQVAQILIHGAKINCQLCIWGRGIRVFHRNGCENSTTKRLAIGVNVIQIFWVDLENRCLMSQEVLYNPLVYDKSEPITDLNLVGAPHHRRWRLHMSEKS